MTPADPDRPPNGLPRPRPAAAPVEPGTGPFTPAPGNPAVSQSGARFVGARRDTGRPPSGGPPPSAALAVVRNGYDRAQVDRRISDLTARLVAAEEHRTDVTRRLAAERQRAERLEQELRETRAALQAAKQGGAPETDSHTGFGYRAERILRMAEAEAHDARTTAASEAASLLERSHAEAEAHRHEVQKDLIARAAVMEDETAQRTALLDARERKLADDLDAARHEAEQLRGAARHDAERIRREAAAAAERAAAEAEQAAQRRRETATAELDRMAGVQQGMRDDLLRLHRMITTALPAEPRTDEPAETAERVAAGQP